MASESGTGRVVDLTTLLPPSSVCGLVRLGVSSVRPLTDHPSPPRDVVEVARAPKKTPQPPSRSFKISTDTTTDTFTHLLLGDLTCGIFLLTMPSTGHRVG